MFCQNIFSVGRECYKNATLDVPVKEKRSRTAFTTEQLNYLEQEYKACPYSEHDRLCKIANIIKKPEKVVKIWFQNRRSRERKSKQSVTQQNKLEISGTNKSITTPNSNVYVANKPSSVTQIDYKSQFCHMAQIQNIMSKNNQLNRINDFNTRKQAVNLHKIINNVRKDAYPKPNLANCKDKTMKMKTKMSTSKMNKNALANTRICYAHQKTTEIKPDYNFIHNNSNLPNSSNFFISGNNSAINFAPKELLGFPSKSVGQSNFNPKGLKQEKNMPHNMFQIQETRKSAKKCSCNCKPKSKQTGAQKIQNPQVPYVILIPCLK